MKFTVTAPETDSEFSDSSCWRKGREIFLTRLRASSKHLNEADTDRFLLDNFHIEKIINTCQAMKTKAEKEYHAIGGPGNLMRLLQQVRGIGDPFLQCAPESISIAWSAISILISVGIKDLEQCDRISATCSTIVTIVLNCRLYENRYNEEAAVGGDSDTEREIIHAIQEIIALVLDFAWHARYHLNRSKLVRSFKDIFSSKIKTRIEVLEEEYKKLRLLANDAFQARVMDYVENLRKGSETSTSAIQTVLFPTMDEIKTDVLAVKRSLNREEIRKRFQDLRQYLNPTDYHDRLFLATFKPIEDSYGQLSQWLFMEPGYQDWVEPMGQTSLLCITGPPGFGKSVIMTCVFKRLRELSGGDQSRIPLHFYFKKGDEDTQLTTKAMESIAAQLVNFGTFSNDENDLQHVVEILESAKGGTVVKSGDNGDSHRNDDTTSNQKHGSSAITGSLGNTVLQHIIEQVGALLMRPIYIVVDAVDECEDGELQGFVTCLMKLSTSKACRIKVIISSRDNVDIESILGVAKESNFSNTPHVRVICVNEETNAKDMQIYLSHEVKALMTRSIQRKDALSEQEIRDIVDSIQKKATGSFRYAEMAIASLKLPYRLSLDEKLRQLPDGMDGLYQKSFESLNPEERTLVYIALTRIVWGSSDISVVEIAEQYKRVYESEIGDLDDYSGLQEVTPENGGQYDPANDPEIADTVFHLKRAGGEFFKFADPTPTGAFDVQHKSVRDWVENEAKQALDWQHDTSSLRSFFSKDDRGQWRLSLPIPASVFRSHNSAIEFQAEKNAQLEITLHLLTNLNHPLFQERYMPWDPSKVHRETDDGADKGMEDTGSSGSEEQIRTVDLEMKETVITVTTTDIGSVDGSGMIYHDQVFSEDINSLLAHGVSEPGFHTAARETEDHANSAISLKIPDRSQISKHHDGDKENDQVHENTQGINLAVPHADQENEGKGSVASISLSFPAPRSRNSDNPATTESEQGFDIDDGREALVSQEIASTGKRFRYELTELHNHLAALEKLWPSQDRQGDDWNLLWARIRNFIVPRTFDRFRVQYWQHTWMYTLQESYEPKNFFSPLHWAARNGLLLLVTFLVEECGADVNAEDGGSLTPLHLAVQYPRVVEYLVGRGGHLDALGSAIGTPLLSSLSFQLISKDKTEYLNFAQSSKILIASGASLNSSNADGETALHFAVRLRDLELVESILPKDDEQKAREIVNSADSFGYTPLHKVFWGSDDPEIVLEIAKRLCSVGADPNAQDIFSSAPLADAVNWGHEAAISLLLDHNADIHDDDHWGYTALHLALTEGSKLSLNIVRTLLDRGADFERQTKDTHTPLTMAIKRGNVDIVGLFLNKYREKYGDDRSFLLRTDKHGRTLLYRSAATPDGGSVDISRLLIQDLTQDQIEFVIQMKESDEGRAPLHVAAMHGNKEMLLFLIGLHAHVRAMTNGGHMAIDLTLKEWLKLVNTPSPETTATERYESCLLLLLDLTPEVLEENVLYLQSAAAHRWEELLLRASQYGVNPCKTDPSGWNSFHVAQAFGNLQTFRDYFQGYNCQEALLSPTHRPTQMSSIYNGDHINISENGMEFWIDASDVGDLIIADHPIAFEVLRFYFEVSILNSENPHPVIVGVGLTGQPAKYVDALPGWLRIGCQSFGYHGDDGRLFRTAKHGNDWEGRRGPSDP